MGPVLIEVFPIVLNHHVQVTFPENQQVIQTFAPDTAEQALNKGVGLGGLERLSGSDNLSATAFASSP